MMTKFVIMNKIKIIILVLVNLIFLKGISGQTPVNLTDSLSQRFTNYVSSVPREEIFIHTDRQDYISGENFWFNVYLIDRQSFRLSSYSSIVYFELLNSENRLIIQKKISIHNGSGPGAIVIPDTLKTGNYKIRAYTSWMRNFLPDNCFLKNIRVYNALNVKKVYEIKSHASAIKNGTGANIRGIIREAGISLRINNLKQDFLELSVETDNKFRTASGVFYVFIQTHGNINHVSRHELAGPVTQVLVPKSQLSGGINQVTIFNSKGNPVALKYIYTASGENSHFTLVAADSCGLRDKIKLELNQKGIPANGQDSAHVSISVAPYTGNAESLGIRDYMIFGSEYGLENADNFRSSDLNQLTAQSVDSILSNLSSNWIDWSVILSDKKPELKYHMETYGPVILGKLLSGDKKSVASHEKVFLCIPGKDPEFQYSITDDEGNFSFDVASGEQHGDLILVPEDNTGKHKITLRSSFSDIYPQNSVTVDSSSGILERVISKMGVNHQVQAIFGISAGSNQLTKSPVLTKPLRFYGKPDIELVLSEFISLPVMSEVFFELLPGVSLKKKQSGYEISITEHVNDEVNVILPTLMIDGVIIPDASMIANLDPELVEKIDIVKSKYVVGRHLFSGIVNVITKTGDYSSVSVSDNMMRVPYVVTDPLMKFISPDYSSVVAHESRLPDYRNTLYWDPSVKTDKDGKALTSFWSSDNMGDYLINIQGVTSDGNLFSIQKIIRIR